MQRIRRSRRRRWRPQVLTPLQRIEQGEGGERALQVWLDRSRLAYLFLDQTPLTMPTMHRADIKRPDFLVAIDGLGTVAVDAKAKAFIDGHFVLEFLGAPAPRRLRDHVRNSGLVCVLPAKRVALLLPFSQPRPDGRGSDP